MLKRLPLTDIESGKPEGFAVPALQALRLAAILIIYPPLLAIVMLGFCSFVFSLHFSVENLPNKISNKKKLFIFSLRPAAALPSSNPKFISRQKPICWSGRCSGIQAGQKCL